MLIGLAEILAITAFQAAERAKVLILPGTNKVVLRKTPPYFSRCINTLVNVIWLLNL